MIDYAWNHLKIDNDQIFVVGHSRLGKAALWTAANDGRVARIFANETGCMGIALTNRNIGGILFSIHIRFHYRFAESFLTMKNGVLNKTIDQHFLLALITPRKLYLASADRDIWGDPEGEFLALKHAAGVYKLYGANLPNFTQFPDPETPLRGDIGYYVRSGNHDITPLDWVRFFQFLHKRLYN